MITEPLCAVDFRSGLLAAFSEAEARGAPAVEIMAGDLHWALGDYLGPRHRMATCPDVMRDEIKAGDVVVYKPPKGRGASLTIQYRLPRSL